MRLSPAALAISLALSGADAHAGAFHSASQWLHADAFASAAAPLAATSVFNCADSGPGSLRYAIASATQDITIDLTQLSCSVISLTSGQLTVGTNNMTLIGPGRDSLAIHSANSRLFSFLGPGTLTIQGMTVGFGGNVIGNGGCIVAQFGSIAITDARVTSCISYWNNDSAFHGGGGIYAAQDITVLNSEVSENYFSGYKARVAGGGIFAGGNVVLRNSTISRNQLSTAQASSYGGGVAAKANIEIDDSIVAYNSVGLDPGDAGESAFAAGVDALDFSGTSAVFITNSTISGNHSGDRVGGVLSAAPLQVRNSTIAFNTSVYSVQGAVTYAAGLFEYSGNVDLQSTIIANNTVSGNLFDFSYYKATRSGANNLIMGSDVSPPGTLSGDPLLEPLADNGGPTLTHALGIGSPATGKGNDAANLAFDQRGPGFARTFAGKTDIGAFQTGDGIFNNGFDPPQ